MYLHIAAHFNFIYIIFLNLISNYLALGCKADADCEKGKKCSLKQNGSRSGKFKKFEKKIYKKQSKGVCITAVAPRQLSQMSTHTLSQTLSNNVSTLSPVTVANNVIVTRKPLTDAEKIMNDPSK